MFFHLPGVDLFADFQTDFGSPFQSHGSDIVNFGGALIAGSNLYASAEGDIRNEALRRNFTLTSRHGCSGGACGQRGHEYRPAEFLSGSSMLLTSGADIVNRGAVLSAASMLMAQAERDIVNSAITSQYLYYYVNESSWFGLRRKKKLLYRAVIGEGDMSTEYGSLLLDAGRDIVGEGSGFSAGGDALLEAGRDVVLKAKSEELHNYYKKRGFSGLSYSSNRIQWNEFKSAFTKIEGDSIRIRSVGDVSGSGALLFAANDIDIASEADLTFDAHQNLRYTHHSGWTIGISFGGSSIVESVLSGADGRDVFEAYLATNPSLAAVHQLATAKDQWGTINGILNLGYHLPALASAVNQGSVGKTDTITESLFKQLNPFSWVKENAVLSSKQNATFKDFVTGITFRLGAFSSQREWTESHVSQLVAGNDLALEAGEDLVLAGGTIVSAAHDMQLLAGDDILIAALADSSRTSSSSWGLSLGFATDGITFGVDMSRTSGSSRIFTNAAVTAGGDLQIISNQDTALLGANIKARSITMDVGNDLIVQSRQNVSSSSSHGFNFQVTMSGGVPTGLRTGASNSSSSRRYTDNPTTVVAQEELSIYTGDTTYLLGSAVYSETGQLDLDTGSLIFDNYSDTDSSSSTSVSTTVVFTDSMTVDTARSDAAGSLAYRNRSAVTYATLGAGSIRVRSADEDFSLAALNRDPDNLQRVLSRSSFALEVPGINLKRWSEQVKDMVNLIEAVSADVPDRVRAQGAQAVDLYRDLILSGASPADARHAVGSDAFKSALDKYHEYRKAEQAYGSKAAIPDNVKRAIALGYGVLLGEASAYEGGSFTVPCDLAGIQTECEIALEDFDTYFDEHGADALIDALNLIKQANFPDDLSSLESAIGSSVDFLLFTLIQCSRSEPDVYQEFLNSEGARELIEWAGEEFGVDAQTLYRIGSVIDSGGDVEDINLAWKTNLNWRTRFKIGFVNEIRGTVLDALNAAKQFAITNGLFGVDEQQQTINENLSIIRFLLNNPAVLANAKKEATLKEFVIRVADGDAEAIGHLFGDAILTYIGVKLVKHALGMNPNQELRNLNVSESEQIAFDQAVEAIALTLVKSNRQNTLGELGAWHDIFVIQAIKELEANDDNRDNGKIVLNKVARDGEIVGYRSVFFRKQGGGVRASPDIVYFDPETGKIYAVEIKTGPNAKLSPNQNIVFEAMREGDAEPLKLIRDLVRQFNEGKPVDQQIPEDAFRFIQVTVNGHPGIQQ